MSAQPDPLRGRPALARLYALWPDRGPCESCHLPQALGHYWSIIDRNHRIGVPLRILRHDYGWSRAQLGAVVAAYAEARRLHRPLPGREPR